jgi:hypothetical protein
MMREQREDDQYAESGKAKDRGETQAESHARSPAFKMRPTPSGRNCWLNDETFMSMWDLTAQRDGSSAIGRKPIKGIDNPGTLFAALRDMFADRSYKNF